MKIDASQRESEALFWARRGKKYLVSELQQRKRLRPRIYNVGPPRYDTDSAYLMQSRMRLTTTLLDRGDSLFMTRYNDISKLSEDILQQFQALSREEQSHNLTTTTHNTARDVLNTSLL